MALASTALVTLVQAKAYLRIDQVASLHVDAEYVGVGDGADKTFSLDNSAIVGSLKLYVNNVLQTETTHYSISGADITFVTAPTNTHPITAAYDYAASADTFESYDDDILERMIEAATQAAEKYIGCRFVERSITETHIGDGRQVMRLYWQPVTDVTSITIGDDSVATWAERLTIGRIEYEPGFAADYEVVVVYDAGYGADRDAAQAAVPDAVLAVLEILSDMYENRGDRVGALSISGIGSVTWNLPSRARELLNPLRTEMF